MRGTGRRVEGRPFVKGRKETPRKPAGTEKRTRSHVIIPAWNKAPGGGARGVGGGVQQRVEETTVRTSDGKGGDEPAIKIPA